jgi:hypothetical protein
MEKEFEYSASKSGGERSIILNDLSKDFPTQRLKVVGFEQRIGKSGTPYPCLLLLDDEGKKFSCSAWDRDVEECVNEWGVKPSLWRGNYVTVKKGQYSGYLTPALEQTPPEERIDESQSLRKLRLGG